MVKETDFVKMKQDLENLARKKQRLLGERDALNKRLKNEFKVDNLESAKVKQIALQEEKEKLDQQCNKLFQEIQTDYRSMLEMIQ